MQSAKFIEQNKISGVVLVKEGDDPAANSPDRILGDIWLTAHHIIFSAPPTELQLLYTDVEQTKLHPLQSGDALLVLSMRNLTKLQFYINIKSHAQNMNKTLQNLKSPKDHTWLCSFQSQGQRASADPMRGWKLYDDLAELERIGVNVSSDAEGNKGEWRVSKINAKLKACASYPPLLAVPATIDDMVLEQLVKYRAHGRFPVLCYLHPSSQCPLLRSGQPLCGAKGHRCYEDEQMLRNIQVNSSAVKGIIIDTRSATVASANASKGGGSEIIDRYYSWERHYAGIAHWNTLKDALAKLLEATQDLSLHTSPYLGKVEASGWLTHVQSILMTSVKTVTHLEHQCAVLVHGSNGWDVTAAVVALAQLMLDPYFRSVQGFLKLVEKEWIRMGHPFTSRMGHFGKTSKHERAPTFLIFLDCVYQILRQMPRAFEFNEAFLLLLHAHSGSSEYGTFLFDDLRQRQTHKLDKSTTSLWAFFLQDEMKDIYNPLYDKRVNGLVVPSTRAQALELWQSAYCRINYGELLPHERLERVVAASRDKHATVKAELAQLLEEIEKLEVSADTPDS